MLLGLAAFAIIKHLPTVRPTYIFEAYQSPVVFGIAFQLQFKSLLVLADENHGHVYGKPPLRSVLASIGGDRS
jgi:hypothetical protein